MKKQAAAEAAAKKSGKKKTSTVDLNAAAAEAESPTGSGKKGSAKKGKATPKKNVRVSLPPEDVEWKHYEGGNLKETLANTKSQGPRITAIQTF